MAFGRKRDEVGGVGATSGENSNAWQHILEKYKRVCVSVLINFDMNMLLTTLDLLVIDMAFRKASFSALLPACILVT